MNMKRTYKMLVLITALLVWATVATGETPATDANIWAPTGDLVGQTNHATLTGTVLDGYGYQAKATEDWQLSSEFTGSVLFGLFRNADNGKEHYARGYLSNGLDGKPNGHFTSGCNVPGKRGWTFDYRTFDHKYDATSEMRSPAFAAGPEPAALAVVPSYGWDRISFAMNMRISEAFGFDLGLSQMKREGTKGSLSRGFLPAPGAAPGVKVFDTKTNKIWVKGKLAAGDLAANVDFAYLASEGDRLSGTSHTYTDDQSQWNLGLDAKYNLSSKMQVLGGAMMADATGTQAETIGITSYLPETEAKTKAGHLGLISRVGNGTTVRLTGQFKKQETSGQTNNEDLSVAQAMDRDRSSQDFRAQVTTTAVAKTRIQLHYKYRSSNLEETVASGELPGVATDFQTSDQDRTRQDAGLKLRYRFNRKVGLKGLVGWKKTEITEESLGEGSGANWLYRLGNRNLDQLKWELSLALRPTPGLKLDLGHQSIDQTYERLEPVGVETTWVTHRGFAVANWTATPRLTVLASASLGKDEYAMTDGPVAAGTMSPLLYEGTTVRFAPGAVFQATSKLNLEAIYELVNFEDKGDAPDGGNDLKSDCSRLLLRAGYDLKENIRLSAAFRRQEFDENRWDDYILDIYSLSVTGKF